jgi:hypothetical protein
VVAQGVLPLSTTLTITTTASTASLLRPEAPGRKPGEPIFLATLTGMGLFGMLLVGSGKKRSQRRAAILLGLMLMLMSLTLVGCSGTSTGATAKGTPAGSYLVAVTATGTGTGAPTHSLNLTLVVQ